MSRVSIADMKIRDLIGRLGKKEVNGNAARVGCMQVMVRRLCSSSRLSSRGLVRLLSRLRLSSHSRGVRDAQQPAELRNKMKVSVRNVGGDL